MLNFIFGADTTRERDDTKKLFTTYRALYEAHGLSGDDLEQDVAEVMEALTQTSSLGEGSQLYQALTELLTNLAQASDLYSELICATEQFSDDVALDADNRARMVRRISLLEHADASRAQVKDAVFAIAQALLSRVPKAARTDAGDAHQRFDVSLIDVMDDVPGAITELLQVFLWGRLEDTSLFWGLRDVLAQNCERVHEYVRKNALPADLVKDRSLEEVLELFLGRTELQRFFKMSLPLSLPPEVRFEHMLLVAGSGHGKTQTLQYFIARDLRAVEAGQQGFAVIDSQGDMIAEILRRKQVSGLGDKVLLIDPNDIAHPPALNLFDIGLAATADADLVEREKIINGAIDLYSYIFSSLLGAELTQKQSVIFTYLARLMLVIPGATIHTLRDLLHDATPFLTFVNQLDPSSKHFFENQFFTKTYAPTRQQVLVRLTGVLANPTFERMFSASENRVDLFRAMNEGKIVLINTAKDLLKSEGCSIFGRFFIAQFAQAALSRSVMKKEDRTPFFVMIDEAHDYFDDKIEDIANQARKYNVGLSLAHQNLDQATTKFRASIMSSTTTKFVGGVSAKDAQVFAQNMRTTSDQILRANKGDTGTEFACYIRNVTPVPVMVRVPFGSLESLPENTPGERQAFIKENRERVSLIYEDNEPGVPQQADMVPNDEESASEAIEASGQGDDGNKGKGGPEHQALQRTLVDAAQQQGLDASVEYHLGGGKHCDVMIIAGTQKIACEISVSTSLAHEITNVQKCLEAGASDVWLISNDETWRSRSAEVLGNDDALKHISVFLVEEAVNQLEGLAAQRADVVSVGGREVVTEVVPCAPWQQAWREIVLAKIFSGKLT